MFKQATIINLKKPLVLPTEGSGVMPDMEVKDPQGLTIHSFGLSKHEHFEGNLFFRCSFGYTVFQFEKRSRIVPAAAVKKRYNEMLAQAEARVGHKLNRKDRLQLKDEVRDAMIPTAFIRSTKVMCVTKGKNLIVGTATPSIVEEVILVLQSYGIPVEVMTVATIDFAKWMTGVMSEALTTSNDIVQQFAVLDKSVLKTGDTVMRANGDVNVETLIDFIAQGATVTQLRLRDQYDTTFTLTDSSKSLGMVLKGIKFDGGSIADTAGDMDGLVTVTSSALVTLSKTLIDAVEEGEL